MSRRWVRRPAAPTARTPPIPAASPSCSSRARSARATARQIIDRLRPQFAQVPGANVFLQPTQDINVGARIGRGSYQYTLQDAERRRADRVVAEDAGEAQDPAATRRRLERSPRQRAADAAHHQPRPGVPLRHLAAAHRRHAQRCLWAAPDHPVLHPAQHLFRDPGDPAGAAGRSGLARPALCEVAAHRRASFRSPLLSRWMRAAPGRSR